MYSYHNRNKQRIKAGELVGYSFADDYKKQGPRMVLHFNKGIKYRPIKHEKVSMYHDVMAIYPKFEGVKNYE